MPATLLAVAIGLLSLSACGPKLPEAESEGARTYAARCTGCHRLYAPSVLTFDMWRMKVDAMQGEMARRGVPPLSDQERTVVLDYLRRHSG